MKKILTILLLNLIFVCCAVGFSACGGVEFKINFIVDGEIYATVNTNGAETIKMPDNPVKGDYTFDGWFWDKDTWQKPFTANSLLDAPLSSDMSVYAKWTYNGENIQPDTIPAEIEEYFEKQADGSYYGKVYNTTDKFDFNGKIQSETDFYVCKDSACTQIINDNTTSLNLGDNVFYILFADGNKTTATVRRRIICTVTFDTANGTIIDSQKICEDTKATMPKNPMRLGYTFSAWDFDFNQPITEHTTITAIWNANKNTPYKIEYYLQNLENDNYTLQESDTENLTGTTDTTAMATKTYEHFTVIENTASGNINADGTTVLKVYYDLEKFTVIINSNSNINLSQKINAKFKYGSVIEKTTATLNLGYEWQGWYSDNELKTLDYEIPSFKVDKNINYIAQCEVKEEMSNLNFESNLITCIITGLKNQTITEIILPDYVTNLAASCFYNCQNLQTIIISDSVTNIGAGAFRNCYSLTHITIGKNVASIGNAAFSNCYRLIQVFNKSSLNIGAYDYVHYYAKNIFTPEKGENKLKSQNEFIIYDDNILVGYNGTESEITIPDCITEINNYALYLCSTLKSITIPNSVTCIGDHSFDTCDNLTNITIPDSVTRIGYGAFKSCNSLYSMTIPFTGQNKDGSGFGYIFGVNDFKNNYVDNVKVVPPSLKVLNITGGKIKDYAFNNCTSLEQITLSDNIKSIGEYAFYQCSSLQSIVLPKNIIHILNGTFSECVSLKNIVIPNSVTAIASYAFYNCKSLKSIIFPENVKTIAGFAFQGCSLTNVYFEKNDGWECCGIYSWDNYYDIQPNDVEYTKDCLNGGCSFKNQ